MVSTEKKLSNEELWVDSMESSLPDMDSDRVPTYLDKQTLERAVVDDAMMDKAAFI